MPRPQLITALLAALVLAACGGPQSPSLTTKGGLSERQLVATPDLRAELGHTVVVFLEHPGAESVHDGDTADKGTDAVPYRFDTAYTHTFSFEGGFGLNHRMELFDGAGSRVLAVAAGESVTATLPAGDYRLVLHHEGRENAETSTLFIHQAALGTGGLGTLADPNAVTTLLKYKRCEGCDLTGANLEFADLGGADLLGANLSGARMEGVTLSSADLRNANLSGANVSGALLTFAQMTGANLSNTDLSYSDLSEATGVSIPDSAILCGTTLPDGTTVSNRNC